MKACHRCILSKWSLIYPQVLLLNCSYASAFYPDKTNCKWLMYTTGQDWKVVVADKSIKKFRVSLDVGIYGKNFLGTFLVDIIHHVWSFYDELLVQLIVAGMTLDFPEHGFLKKEGNTWKLHKTSWSIIVGYVALCLFQ